MKAFRSTSSNWYYAFDLREITDESADAAVRTMLDRMDIEVYQLLEGTRVAISFQQMLDDFRTQSMHLQMLLFTLAAPMIAMVFYFIAMNSRQSLERQKQRYRGAAQPRRQHETNHLDLFARRACCSAALRSIIGPMIGWFMAKSIGSSTASCPSSTARRFLSDVVLEHADVCGAGRADRASAQR